MIEAVTTSPLFGIVLCIGTFQIGRWVQKKTGHVGDEKIGFFLDVVGGEAALWQAGGTAAPY